MPAVLGLLAVVIVLLVWNLRVTYRARERCQYMIDRHSRDQYRNREIGELRLKQPGLKPRTPANPNWQGGND